MQLCVRVFIDQQEIPTERLKEISVCNAQINAAVRQAYLRESRKDGSAVCKEGASA